VVKSDYCKWVKEKIRQRWQNEWRNSTSSMVTIKPHVKRYDSTISLTRWQQVAVSRLIMGYTNIIQEMTVEHLIWQCAMYNSESRRNSVTKDSMGDNREVTGRLIKYFNETGLLYSI
jgi:hypothetical protein